MIDFDDLNLTIILILAILICMFAAGLSMKRFYNPGT